MEEELTLVQAEELGDNFIVFYTLDEAQHYVMRAGGIIYTQVDTEEGPMYMRGVHYVNRTGVYGVLIKEAHNASTNTERPMR